ncbi:MAG: hypothetical protein OHK0022_49850 [Roseiflexaceae bacterium]
MAQIDITVVFDTDGILADANLQGGTQSSPKTVNYGYIYMITDQANVVSGQAGNELNISANPTDQIRWQATSATLASVHTVALYAFQFYNPNDPANQLISTPELYPLQMTYYYGNHGNPLQFTAQKVWVPVWLSTVLQYSQPGQTVTYNFDFTILDTSGNTHGYYRWDPYITVASS